MKSKNKKMLDKFNMFYGKLDDLICELTTLKQNIKYLEREQNINWINEHFDCNNYEEDLIMFNNVIQDLIELNNDLYNLANDIEE